MSGVVPCSGLNQGYDPWMGSWDLNAEIKIVFFIFICVYLQRNN